MPVKPLSVPFIFPSGDHSVELMEKGIDAVELRGRGVSNWEVRKCQQNKTFNFFIRR